MRVQRIHKDLAVPVAVPSFCSRLRTCVALVGSLSPSSFAVFARKRNISSQLLQTCVLTASSFLETFCKTWHTSSGAKALRCCITFAVRLPSELQVEGGGSRVGRRDMAVGASCTDFEFETLREQIWDRDRASSSDASFLGPDARPGYLRNERKAAWLQASIQNVLLCSALWQLSFPWLWVATLLVMRGKNLRVSKTLAVIIHI